jgi:four helix bundle protein
MKGDDIADRLLTFAKRVLQLCRELAKDFGGKHVARQLIRCASGGDSNYEEARGAESLADFVHKMSVARKEVRESLYWLRLVKGDLADGPEIVALIGEANELTAILTSSVKTAKARAQAKSPRLLERDDRTSEMKERQVVRTDSFPSHE